MWQSYLIKWSDGEKEQGRQEEEAAVVAATQKRKMLCKTRRGNSVITVCKSLSLIQKIHLTAFAARAGAMGDQSPEPVDETMSSNQFHR